MIFEQLVPGLGDGNLLDLFSRPQASTTCEFVKTGLLVFIVIMLAVFFNIYIPLLCHVNQLIICNLLACDIHSFYCSNFPCYKEFVFFNLRFCGNFLLFCLLHVVVITEYYFCF